MIIITGGTGTIGKDVVKELTAQKARFVVLARDVAKAKKVLGAGVEVVEGDLAKPESLARAFKGATQLFLLSSAGPNQVGEQHNAIEAAKKAGIGHVVKLSALGASETAKASLGRWHAATEKELKSSGLRWTILQPHSFMQNLLISAAAIKAQGTIYMPMKDAKVALVDTRDIAAVAAHALTDGGHDGKTYVITGPEALSYTQVAEKLSAAIGKPVKYVDVPPEQAKQGMLAAGMPEWLADDLNAITQIFVAGHGAATTDTVAQVARRAPHTFDQFARDYAPAFR